MVPAAVFVVLVVLLGATLTSLDPVNGVWTAARTAVWGNQTETVRGLTGSVTIVRDGAGTAHIYASNDPDLFFGQGYEQASDRLFQMEVESLKAQGSLASWLGPSALTSDETFRYLGVPQAAAAMAAGLASVSPAAAQDLFAFDSGVNAYINWSEAHHAVPIEFGLLGVRPFAWTAYDTFAFDRLMVIAQTTGFTEPLYFAALAASVGDASANEIQPIYPADWQNFTVLPGNGSLNGLSLSQLGVSPGYLFGEDWLGAWATGLPPSSLPSLAPLYRAAIANLSDPATVELRVSSAFGSNAWAVAANHSSLGVPLLANDPHLPLQIPSLWVPTELVDPNYDVAGWALAGLPGVLIGHNAHLAWALTNSEGATALDYVEQLSGSQYFENGSWHPLSYTNETIDVAGAAPVDLTLPWTDNGPVVARLGTVGLSVRWAGTGATWEAIAEIEFDRAANVSTFFADLRSYWTVPNLNALVVSDSGGSGTGGHLAWVIPAAYPLVAVTMPDGATVEVIGSRGPLNGSGAFEPVGSVPFADRPQVEDPAQGYLYTPNQPTVGEEYPFPFVGSWWDSGGRAHSIGTFLAAHPVMSVGLMEALQANVSDAWALLLKPYLVDGLEQTANASSTYGAFARVLLPLVENWNGTFYTGEVAPTFYTYWWNSLSRSWYDPRLAAAGLSSAPSWFPNQVAWIAANDPGNSTWFPTGFLTADQVAVMGALVVLTSTLGPSLFSTNAPPDVSGWTWGAVHTFTLPSITGVAAFGRDLGPENGDSFTVSVAPFTDNYTVPLTEVALGSSLRLVSAPAASPSFGVLPGGGSGNIASAYYDNQLPLWFDHEYTNLSLVPDPAGPFPEGVVSTWTLNP